jgi:ATP-dependent DNA helicase DinG
VTLTPAADPAAAAADALARVVAQLPAGEDRPGQREMARAVAEAIAEEHHLAVQAGTGTGKTHAYLVPALLSGRRTVVVTTTIGITTMKPWSSVEGSSTAGSPELQATASPSPSR